MIHHQWSLIVFAWVWAGLAHCAAVPPWPVVTRDQRPSQTVFAPKPATGDEASQAVLYDVLIIGGGPSGLQAGMSFGRLDRRAVIFDSGVYRNQGATAMHDVVGLDGTPPADFRAKARQQLTNYPAVSYHPKKIVSVENNGQLGHFKAVDEDGVEWLGRYLILATGVREQLLPTKGFEEMWGVSAFWCLWCDGWEHRDKRVAFIGTEHIVNDALMGTRLYTNVTILTNGDEDFEFPSAFHEQGIVIDRREIISFAHSTLWRKDSPVTVTFVDGSTGEFGSIITTNPKVPGAEFGGQLGACHYKDNPVTMVTDAQRRTNVPRVYAVGDAGSPVKNVPAAIDGSKSAAVDIIVRLVQEEAYGEAPEWERIDCSVPCLSGGLNTMERY